MRRPVVRICAVSGCDKSSRAHSAEHCRMHAYWLERYGSTDDPRAPRPCDVCGEVFSPPRADSVTCFEEECRAEKMRRVARGRHASPPVERVRAPKGSVPKPESKSVQAADIFTRTEIADRDNWTCQLCGERVNAFLLWPDPYSMTLHHIVPRSAGGKHSRENCQLAHLKCSGAHLASS